MKRFSFNSNILVILFIALQFISFGQIQKVKELNQSNCEMYLPSPLYADLFKTVPLICAESPEWVKLMYSESPNFFDIENNYESYYKEHEYVKTSHTQNYKYFSRLVLGNRYYNEDGLIYLPNPQEIAEKERALKEKNELYNLNTNNRTADWTCIGPFETFAPDGITYKSSQVNVYTISQSKSNPQVLFAGSEGGNIFKTIDKGLNWNLISKEILLGGIGAIEIDPTNENIIFLSSGNKLLKSVDGGSVWSTLEDVDQLRITDITINPLNANIIFTTGALGLKRSFDGGITWTTMLTDKCFDIELKTDDPSTVFVAKTNTVNNTTEIWKSIDNGLSFFAKIDGWFNPIGGVATNTGGARIGVTDADPNRIFVVLIGNEDDGVEDNNFIGIYRSDDAGESWSTPYDGNGDGFPDNEPGGPYSSDHWCFTNFGLTNTGYNQGFYDLAIDVSDTDADRFLVGSLNLFKSDDGGVSYKAWGGYQCHDCGSGYRHPDIQEIEINGQDVWVTTDGGVDYYDGNLDYQDSRTKGITGSAYWGLGQGWNEDVVTGGRYHNGNGAHHEAFGLGKFIALGGAEAATGYVNQGENRKVYHSDIQGKLLPTTLAGGVVNIPKYSMFPNQAYISNKKSEIVTDPRCWNTLYLGKENKLWKSLDGGISFSALNTFGESFQIILGIEVSRSNPDVIYLVQRISGGGKIWKTTDGGDSWIDLTLPNSTKEMFITVSVEDENTIYLALDRGNANVNKIFKSIDGGLTWVNISDPIMDGEFPKNIQVQGGTDGGVYVVTTSNVYYKNNTIDWQLYSDGLPARIKYEGFLPFYRDSKVRLATANVAIWESPFYELSIPVAQPMASTSQSFCSRDTVDFEDYSIRSAGATWTWSFSPTPDWVSSTSVRNPRVLFGELGSYSATVTVTDVNGTDTKTVDNIITISNECDVETIPGNAMMCTEIGEFVVIPNLELSTNTITMTAWIKPDGNQPNFSGIIFNDGTSAGLNFNNGKLAYHWPNGAWWWDSGLEVPLNEWSHVALVSTSTGITLYLNGIAASHNFSTDIVDFGSMKLGSYKGWTGRNYKGEIDEVTIYDRSLSQDEIRALRHLTKVPTDDSSLIHYYQFNRDEGVITDRVGGLHCYLSGGAIRVVSTVPIGGGQSAVLNINSAGIKDFNETGLVLDFLNNGTYPDGDVWTTRIDLNPDVDPGTDPIDQKYWVINNYGLNNTFSTLESIQFNGLTNVNTANNGENNELYKRNANDEGNSWGDVLDSADNSTDTSILFSTGNGVNSFGQFAINATQIVSESNIQGLPSKIVVFPNPSINNNEIYIKSIFNEKLRVEIYSSEGKIKGVYFVENGKGSIDLHELLKGSYFYKIIGETYMKNGVIVLQ